MKKVVSRCADVIVVDVVNVITVVIVDIIIVVYDIIV